MTPLRRGRGIRRTPFARKPPKHPPKRRKAMRRQSDGQADVQRDLGSRLRARVRAGERCWLRPVFGGCSPYATFHHRLSRGKGGKHSDAQLVLLCSRHHLWLEQTVEGRVYGRENGLHLNEDPSEELERR